MLSHCLACIMKKFCSLLMILLYLQQVKKKCFLDEKFLKEK